MSDIERPDQGESYASGGKRDYNIAGRCVAKNLDEIKACKGYESTQFFDTGSCNFLLPRSGKCGIPEEIKLTFGAHKGKKLSDPEIPDRYICWLAKPKYSGSFYKSLHVTDLKWRVPWPVIEAARKEAERRGYALKGETWEK